MKRIGYFIKCIVSGGSCYVAFDGLNNIKHPDNSMEIGIGILFIFGIIAGASCIIFFIALITGSKD